MTWLFWGAVVLIGYTYAGISALALVAPYRCARWPVQSGSIQPFVSVVMVVRNEERRLERRSWTTFWVSTIPSNRLKWWSCPTDRRTARKVSCRDMRGIRECRLCMNQLSRWKGIWLERCAQCGARRDCRFHRCAAED